MSIDISVAPCLGGFGYRLYRKTGIFLGKTYTENIATNNTFRNIYYNFKRIDNYFKKYPLINEFLEKDYIDKSRINSFAKEFNQLTLELKNIPIEKVILNAPKGEDINGTIVEDLGSIILFQPSKEYLDKIKMDNNEWAQSEGKKGFKTETIYDLFWYQFENIDKLIKKAIDLHRGLYIE
ncbi:MAG: hypothetical protein K6U80_18285 [Firmicutes bacterium]|nr:hypothetical protein [Bacillota bacterium]